MSVNDRYAVLSPEPPPGAMSGCTTTSAVGRRCSGPCGQICASASSCTSPFPPQELFSCSCHAEIDTRRALGRRLVGSKCRGRGELLAGRSTSRGRMGTDSVLTRRAARSGSGVPDISRHDRTDQAGFRPRCAETSPSDQRGTRQPGCRYVGRRPVDYTRASTGGS